jgi:hypothetical protein
LEILANGCFGQSGDRRTFEHPAANAITERADTPPLESAHLGTELAANWFSKYEISLKWLQPGCCARTDI